MGDSHKPLLRFNEFARVVHRTQRNICLHLPVYCKRCYEGHKDTLDTWQSSGRDSELSLPRDQVQSPVGELTCSSKTKKKDIDVTDVQPDGRKKCLGKGMGKVVWRSQALSEHASSTSRFSPTQKPSDPCAFVFLRSLHYIDMID